MRPHPTETIERIRELRIHGCRSTEIAEVCGVSRGYVAEVTRDLPRPPRRNLVQPATAAQMREMVFCGVSRPAIAKLLGLSVGTVYRHTEGIPSDAKLAREQVREKIRTMYQRGDTWRAIATELGVNPRTIHLHVRDLPRRTPKPEKTA